MQFDRQGSYVSRHNWRCIYESLFGPTVVHSALLYLYSLPSMRWTMWLSWRKTFFMVTTKFSASCLKNPRSLESNISILFQFLYPFLFILFFLLPTYKFRLLFLLRSFPKNVSLKNSSNFEHIFGFDKNDCLLLLEVLCLDCFRASPLQTNSLGFDSFLCWLPAQQFASTNRLTEFSRGRPKWILTVQVFLLLLM